MSLTRPTAALSRNDKNILGDFRMTIILTDFRDRQKWEWLTVTNELSDTEAADWLQASGGRDAVG